MPLEPILPRKRSALLRVAIADLEQCEQDPAYRVDMTEWHTGNLYRERCAVCLAGSVMAKSLAVQLTYSYRDVYPYFHHADKKALDWLNDIRALIEYQQHIKYLSKPHRFKEAALKLANEFEAHPETDRV